MLRRMFALEGRIPEWGRPTYRGAVFILGMMSGWLGKLFVFLMAATLILMAGPGPGLALFFTLLGVSLVAGAVGGAIHGLLHEMDHWGRAGTWIRWTVAIFGYVVAFGSLTPQVPVSFLDPALYALAAVISILGAGVVILLDERRSNRPSPRRFQWLKDRERLWAESDRARARGRPGRVPAGAASATSAIPLAGPGRATRETVKEQWIQTIRKSHSRLSWWTRP